MFAQPYYRRSRSALLTRASTAYTPVQLAQHYDFPKVPQGPDQVIAIGELGGGYRLADITAYMGQLGLPVPRITDVSVRGAHNSPGQDADTEVMLDILVAAAAYSYCTGQPADLLLVFAPNDQNGMSDATRAALNHPSKPSVFSWSWGAPEDVWGDTSFMDIVLQKCAEAGLTVTAAAGDNGSGDGERGNNVDYPASSPYVLACGGTTLPPSGPEVVWNDGSRGGATGGGYSAKFAKPAWQQGLVTGQARGVPDVAANADPDTGYVIRVNGQPYVIGGTSAVAPLLAALIAVYNRALHKRLGLVQPAFYANAKLFRDVISGNNGAFQAGPGWDADTGLGSPDGSKLLEALKKGGSSGGGGPPAKPPVTPTAAAVKAAVDAGVLTGLQQVWAKYGNQRLPSATLLNLALPVVMAAVNHEIDVAYQA